MAGASGYASCSIKRARLRKSGVRLVTDKMLSPHGHPNNGLTPAHRTVTSSCLPRLTVGLLTPVSDATAHNPFELSALPSATSHPRNLLREARDPPHRNRLLRFYKQTKGRGDLQMFRMRA